MQHSFINTTPDSHFPIQNLPYGVFSTPGEPPRIGVAIGDFVLDLAYLAREGLLLAGDLALFDRPSLNLFMGAGTVTWARVRAALQTLLDEKSPTLRDNTPLRDAALVPLEQVTLHLPAEIGDYTDFYSSLEHASNVGRLFRGPDDPLLPNWRHLPVAYHGRASSIIVSGSDIRRPQGQIFPAGRDGPIFGPTAELDFELEVGCLIGPGNNLGSPISLHEAERHVFGLVLVNDWSARDIQRWEYRPLGPFLGKNFATSISPWVVPLAALEPFRTAGPTQQPSPLPYLAQNNAQTFDLTLEVALKSGRSAEAVTLSKSNFKHLYWSIAQQIAHHTSGGCNLRPGDLLASGTISGTEPDSWGSLLELTFGGRRPLALPEGETRSFLEDGDTVILSGWGQGDGYRVGFGELHGRVRGEVDQFRIRQETP